MSTLSLKAGESKGMANSSEKGTRERGEIEGSESPLSPRIQGPAVQLSMLIAVEGTPIVTNNDKISTGLQVLSLSSTAQVQREHSLQSEHQGGSREVRHGRLFTTTTVCMALGSSLSLQTTNVMRFTLRGGRLIHLGIRKRFWSSYSKPSGGILPRPLRFIKQASSSVTSGKQT